MDTKPEVFFTDLQSGYGRSLLEKAGRLFDAAGFGDMVEDGRTVAVKVHFGEPGNAAFLSPLFAREIVERITARGGKPFLTDTNTLYRGRRNNAVDHLSSAHRHGFNEISAGAPVIIADGLTGRDYEEVPINGEFYEKVKIAGAIRHAHTLIVLSHFKGHTLFGFGGAMKNIGMGCACPAGKQTIHSDVKPKIKPSRCRSCGDCLAVCPVEAIFETAEGKSKIDRQLCIGCGECVAVCSCDAVIVQWKTDEAPLQKKTAEYGLGAVAGKRERTGFINFLVNITPQCDCEPWNNPAIVPDLGILASVDPVAVDQASLDMVNNVSVGPFADSKDKMGEATGRDWSHILKHGEKIGLGSRSYKLVRI